MSAASCQLPAVGCRLPDACGLWYDVCLDDRIAYHCLQKPSMMPALWGVDDLLIDAFHKRIKFKIQLTNNTIYRK